MPPGTFVPVRASMLSRRSRRLPHAQDLHTLEQCSRHNPWRSNEAFTMKRIFAVAYGAACYAIFLGCFLYLVGFLAGFGVPKTIDSGGHGFHIAIAALIDLALIALFGVQHSMMARPAF